MIAVELAALFVGPQEAVIALLIESQDGATPEGRARAWHALMQLDPDTPPPHWALDRPPDALEQLVNVCLRYLYDAPTESKKAGALISARCRQAIQAWERQRSAA